MRTALRALAAALLGLALLASPATAQEGPVGGPLLGSTGTVLGVGAPPVPPVVVAHGWLVADLDSGEVLGAKNAHGRFAPASTLKVLTAVALPPLLRPDQRLVPEFDDVAVDGSKVGLVERVGYPVDELFQALMMVSGNDVAMTLARGAGGPAAIDAMNAEARRLQARDTVAVNPSGLDADGQVSSPYDLALLARAGMASPDFRRWVSTRRGSVSGPGGKRIQTYNHNKLLTTYDGALGIKNGYTSRAKASFVGAATRNGRTLVVTTMRTQPRVHVEAAALLDWGFAALTAGAQPVGTLVEPLAEGAAAAGEGEVTSRSAGAAGHAAPADGQAGPPLVDAVLDEPLAADDATDADSGLPVQALALGLAAGAVLVVRRRRQVVLARSAARRRASTSVPYPAGTRSRPPRPAGPRPTAAAGSGPSRRAPSAPAQPARRQVPRR